MGKEIVFDKTGRKFLGDSGLAAFEYQAEVVKLTHEEGKELLEGSISIGLQLGGSSVYPIATSFYVDLSSDEEKAEVVKLLEEEIRVAATLRTQFGRIIKDLRAVKDLLIADSVESDLEEE